MRLLQCFVIAVLLFQYSNAQAQNCLTSSTVSSSRTYTYVISNNDECLTITSSGSLSAQSYAIDNNAKQRTSIINEGALTSGANGETAIYNPGGSITNLMNKGSITVSSYSHGIDNMYSSTISDLTNSGTISSGTNSIGILNFDNSNILSLTNSGTISLVDGQGIMNWDNSAINTLINSGSILAGDFGTGIGNQTNSTITILNNNGTISSGDSGIGIGNYNSSTISILTNSGTISVGGYDAFGIANTNNSIINSIVNMGQITAEDNDAFGILNNGSTIVSLINNGSITTGNLSAAGIYNFNNGVITNLINLQGGNSSSHASTALTYIGILPTNYKIIINSPTHYGQLSVTAPTGSTSFGIYNSSVVTSRLYTGVLQGLTTSNVNTSRTGTYDGMTWTLALQNGSSTVWDLIFSGASTTYTQLSLNRLASQLRGAFSGQTVATNFANMNTYDCNLFDSKGLCISVGGQQTYLDSPSSNMTSSVVVAGYKVSPTLRIGGFLNQNINSHTGSNVDLSNNTPLMGLFAVWNQNENHLGYQVKIANAYQDMDVTTTRDVIGTSEAGKGKTDLNTQSYVGEVSYALLANEDKTLVRSYAAIRYTRIKQDSYSERTTSAVTAPLTYAALSDRSTVALMGVKLNHKINDKMNLTGSLGVEQDLNHHVDNLTASGVSGLTSENFNNNINRTRPVASIGGYYMPLKNQRIAADIYYQELPFQSTASTTAYVNYMIGF